MSVPTREQIDAAITREQRTRRCRCNQNTRKFSCGHSPVTVVEWIYDGRTFYTRKGAVAALVRNLDSEV